MNLAAFMFFRTTIVMIGLAFCRMWTIELFAQATPAEILAVSSKDGRFAWKISPEVLAELRSIESIRPKEAKELGEAFLSAALTKRQGDKKECCYKKVADGVWSCCDGRFVTTTAPSLMKVFQLSQEAPAIIAGEPLSGNLEGLLRKLKNSNSFTPIRIGDGDEQVRSFLNKLGDAEKY